MSLNLDRQRKHKITSSGPQSDGTRVRVHVVAPAFGDKMEHLRELQWIGTVVNLDDDERAWSNEKVAPAITFVITHQEQAGYAHDE